MFETFRNAWKVEELKKKILYTLFIILIFRLGSAIPVPFLDKDVIAEAMASAAGVFGFLNVITGGSFSTATIFALSVTPYINASIIINLLTVAIPALERLQKDGGEEGKKKIQMITRYSTLGLALITGIGYYLMLKRSDAVVYTTGVEGAFALVVILTVFIAGALFVMWLGEQCNSKGIGNGISMLIFAGIISRGPAAASTLIAMVRQAVLAGKWWNIVLVVAILVIFLAVIALIVYVTNAERRIPIQYAKRVVGRKMYGGQSTTLPIKVNMTGVLPVIFAGSLLALPQTVAMFVNVKEGSFWEGFFKIFSDSHWFYAVIYFLLIIAFNYFYTAVQYNPVQIANDLRKNSGMIPGIRPGKPTSDFISRVVSRITLIGALFLGVVATLPIIVGAITGVQGLSLGGTSVIILVGVALETSKQLQSQMMMRHYKGFLE